MVIIFGEGLYRQVHLRSGDGYLEDGYPSSVGYVVWSITQPIAAIFDIVSL